MLNEPAIKRRRVLVVDDSDDDVFLLCRAVRRGQIPWTITGVLLNGEEAIEHFEKLCKGRGTAGLPDLLVIDLKMPRKGGFAVLEWMKDNLPKGIVKIAILSSSHATADKMRASELGATEYLMKPESLDGHVDMLRILERSLAGGRER